MTRNLVQRFNRQGSPDQFRAADLLEPTLQQSDEWYKIFEVQGDTTKAYGAGYGPDDDRVNAHGWSDLDLQNSTPDPINGKVRFRVYRDSDQEDLVAQSGKFDLGPLRSAVSAGRKDKILIPAEWSAVAGNDSWLTVEVSPDSSSTGDTVTAANSSTDFGMAFGEIQTTKG